MIKEFTVFVGFLFFCSVAYSSAGSFGKVIFKVGDPIVKNKQGIRDVISGDDLGSGDTINTRSGLVQIQFPDKSFMSLKPKTEFTIESYNYDETSETQDQSKYKLNFGEIRTVSGLIGKKDAKNYNIETPVASIGIRGTKFRVIVFQIGAGDSSEFTMTLTMGESGAVDIFLPTGETLELDAGQVSSLGGVEAIIDFVQTENVTQVIASSEELPLLVELLSNTDGVSKIITETIVEQQPEGEEDSQIRLMIIGGDA